MTLTRMRCWLPGAVALMLALASCTPAAEKADAFESLYDRQMAVQAYPAAVRSIQSSVALDDTTARRYIKLAEVLLLLDRPAAAAGAYQKALDLEPDNIGALQNLSILAVRSGRFDLADQYIQPLLALSANDPAGLLASGAKAIGQRRFKEAIKLADRIIGAMPERADGYVLKARALDALGRSREGAEIIERRLNVAGADKDLLTQLMVSYRKSGNLKGIRATAIELMPLYPEDPRLAFEAARAYRAGGKNADADRVINDLKQRFASYSDVMVAIGNFWRDTLPLPAAQAKIVELATASAPPQRTALAGLLIKLGATDAALGLLRPLATAEITSRDMDAQTHYARALLLNGRTAEAKAKVDAALAADGGNAEALLLRARLRLQAHDYRGAFTDAQLVTRDDETNEEAVLLVAEIYSAQGNPMLAAGAYGDARQNFPDSLLTLRAETDWLLSQDRGNDAAQRVVSFATTHPRNSEAARLRQDVCKRTRAPACSRATPNIMKMLG